MHLHLPVLQRLRWTFSSICPSRRVRAVLFQLRLVLESERFCEIQRQREKVIMPSVSLFPSDTDWRGCLNQENQTTLVRRSDISFSSSWLVVCNDTARCNKHSELTPLPQPPCQHGAQWNMLLSPPGELCQMFLLSGIWLLEEKWDHNHWSNTFLLAVCIRQAQTTTSYRAPRLLWTSTMGDGWMRAAISPVTCFHLQTWVHFV